MSANKRYARSLTTLHMVRNSHSFVLLFIHFLHQLPVISIDGWITMAYAALPDSTPVGTVQAILAVGTAKQISNFKKSKSLPSCSSFVRLPMELYVAQDVEAAEIPGRTTNKTEAISTKNGNGGHNNLTSMFSTFIDSLAARLPDRNLIDSNSMSTATKATNTTSDATTQTNAPTANNDVGKTTAAQGNGKYMRPTSELLDDLQRALAITPSAGQKKGYGLAPVAIPEQKSTTTATGDAQSNAKPSLPPPKMFRVHIEIENALHLPKFAVPAHKKGAKRNRNANNAEQQSKSNGNGSSSGGSTPLEIEPNTYVTFEAAATNAPSNSTTYTTNIIETSCSPRWNKQFEVYLSAEYLQNVGVSRSFVVENTNSNSN